VALEEPRDFAPWSLSTSAAKLCAIIPCNLCFAPSLTGLLTARQDGRHEKTILLQLLFAGALIALVGACATTSRSGPAALAGTWTNSLGAIWTVKADGTFDVDRNHDGKRDIWGTYTVAGDIVTIQATGGKTPKDCKGPGVYKFSRPNENTLTFTLVSDTCKDRKRNVLLAWQQK
jgi:hypothetical protein